MCLAASTLPRFCALLDQRGVLLFRGVAPNDDELRMIARSLGDLRLGASKRGADGRTLNEGDEGVMKISLDANVNPDYARFLPGNHLWHMDGTYEPIPPLATLFTPFKLSQTGGDTCFANTYAAFEDLPAAQKAELEKLRVVHTMQAALFPVMRDVTPEEFAVWYSYPQRSHPLVWHHRSGRKSLVLSTSGAWVEGMPQAKSHDLLQQLMRHTTQDQYVYRHKWQLGDLVIWDNTGAMHRVLPFDRESGREFHRATLNGEEAITSTGERLVSA
ncbi:TauD/TfdA family dioxygenase [Novosphingobium sp. G106]|uniref:TauD/TfdA dioxygenase family protein n=1 Tax=Novosphingobium sp. G106 TaxID=2849500 RepID=UPI0028111769|nr:TauD/TfdA family dioxygenase [Novosphingobium sp. G106]